TAWTPCCRRGNTSTTAYHRAVSQRLRGIFATGLDDAGAAQPVTDVGDGHAVVGQGIDGPIKAEPVVEGGREDEDVRGEHAARVVRHHEGATGGRHGIQVTHLGAEVPLDGRAYPLRDLLGEPGIP